MIARLAEFPATRTVAPGGPNQYVVLCHNAAARLYAAKRFKRAARLFREAARGKAPYHTYIFLAACVWADAKDRHEVMDCLREAAKRDPSGSVWQRAQSCPSSPTSRTTRKSRPQQRVPRHRATPTARGVLLL